MLVELSRGPAVESVHRVDAVVAGPDGRSTVWGDPDRPVFARSALKFIQALPLLRTGAADHFGVTANELVLACSSHSGEPPHVAAVRNWLQRLGLDEGSLECGPDVPLGTEAAIEHHRHGREPSAVLNCCSGKHAGFLTVARHLDVEPRGYIEPDHPVQRLVTEAVEQLTGRALRDRQPGRDGCGIPTFAIPLAALADGMRRLVTPVALSAVDDATAPAAAKLIEAVVGREFWISGTGRHEVTLGGLATEPLLVKTGAEGVFMAALPERGVGVALKVLDGAGRAAEVAISALLAGLGVIPADAVERPIHNKAGTEVGRMTVRSTDGQPIAFDRT